MDWLFKFVLLWLSFDIVLVATGWYAVTTIKPLWPKWWERAVVGVEPDRRPYRYY